MSSSDEGGSSSSPFTPTPTTHHQNQKKRYKGVRRRKWGKWVSEIRVPGSQERLWLGSYVAPEAAAVAHDVAYYCLRERTSPGDFNFPFVLPSGVVERGMSPRSVQKAATDAGMAVDAQIIIAKQTAHHHHPPPSMDEVNIINAPAAVSNPNPNSNSNSIPNITEALELDISVEDYL